MSKKVIDYQEENKNIQAFEEEILQKRAKLIFERVTKGLKNRIYKKKRKVYVIIEKPKGWFIFDLTESQYNQLQMNGEPLHFNFNVRGDGERFPSICNKKLGLMNEPVYRYLYQSELQEGKEIDHQFMTSKINSEGLRICNRVENLLHRKFTTQVDKENNTFRIGYLYLLNVEDLKNKGFKEKNNQLVSPSFRTEKKRNQFIAYLENLIAGPFRYNPFEDYSETWVNYYLYQMGLIGKREFQKRQREWVLSDERLVNYYVI